MKYYYLNIILILLLISALFASPVSAKDSATSIELKDFQSLLISSKEEQDRIISKINNNWSESYIPLLIESLSLARNSKLNNNLLLILKTKTKQDFNTNINKWYQWSWNQNITPPKYYADFKSWAYSSIDPRFKEYFENPKSSIRLDEIRWGGVRRDGIPPLRNPEMISVKKAKYLADDNVVFGVIINGDARAYPKRILAWHEMFTDTIGGVDVTGAYCTLCGSMIAYNSEHKGVKYRLGTSGFLYRSNKLMYDKKTKSLWNTIHGEPVVGDLLGKGIKLPLLSVVTTTWSEWKKRHPNTTVLSLNTGHRRDYSEGNAYKDYFSTDKLMFNVPIVDKRLKNKDEILAIRFLEDKKKLAISAKYLSKNPLFSHKNFIVLTDKSGANRVYERTGDIKFKSWDKEKTLVDSSDIKWLVEEDKIISVDGKTTLKRLPAHRAFWFGWFAANPDTALIGD